MKVGCAIFLFLTLFAFSSIGQSKYFPERRLAYHSSRPPVSKAGSNFQLGSPGSIFSALACKEIDWTVWNSFTSQSAMGSITSQGNTLNITIKSDLTLEAAPAILRFEEFKRYKAPIPNTAVPRTNWSKNGGITTVCFSQSVKEPVLLVASLGSYKDKINATISFSEPYEVLYNAGGIITENKTTLTGREGYALIKFPGDIKCITISSSSYADFTDFTWGIPVCPEGSQKPAVTKPAPLAEPAPQAIAATPKAISAASAITSEAKQKVPEPKPEPKAVRLPEAGSVAKEKPGVVAATPQDKAAESKPAAIEPLAKPATPVPPASAEAKPKPKPAETKPESEKAGKLTTIQSVASLQENREKPAVLADKPVTEVKPLAAAKAMLSVPSAVAEVKPKPAEVKPEPKTLAKTESRPPASKRITEESPGALPPQSQKEPVPDRKKTQEAVSPQSNQTIPQSKQAVKSSDTPSNTPIQSLKKAPSPKLSVAKAEQKIINSNTPTSIKEKGSLAAATLATAKDNRLKIEVWDYDGMDYDSISIKLNGSRVGPDIIQLPLIKRYGSKEHTYALDLQPGNNILEIQAVSEGVKPFATVGLTIMYEDKPKKMYFTLKAKESATIQL